MSNTITYLSKHQRITDFLSEKLKTILIYILTMVQSRFLLVKKTNDMYDSLHDKPLL